MGILVSASAFSAESAVSSGQGWVDRFGEQVRYVWDSGKTEIIAPVRTWHSRARYDKERIKRYNERPWGIGIGKYYTDESGNRHRLLALTFQDSFDKPEPTFAYTWQAVWREKQDFRPTLGFVSGITFRDNYHWIPVPFILPMLGFDYAAFSVEGVYIPVFDVAFTWVVWRF